MADFKLSDSLLLDCSNTPSLVEMGISFELDVETRKEIATIQTVMKDSIERMDKMLIK